MKHIELKGQLREASGKQAIKAIRREGLVPCNLYGLGMENILFTVSAKALKPITNTPNSYIIDLELSNGQKINAVLHELQWHPVTDECLHVDFLAVCDTKPVVIDVPVVVTGHAEGVKAGGKLTLSMKKLKVKATYDASPERIVVNIDNIQLGQSLKVGALHYEGLELMNSKNAVVCAVQLTRAARGQQAQQG